MTAFVVATQEQPGGTDEGRARGQAQRNAVMLTETLALWVGLAALVLALDGVGRTGSDVACGLAVLALGFWLHRIYMVGHESGHRKLFRNRLANDLLGQLAVLPILVPMRVYRKIHVFHHAFNRRDHESAALDTFVVRGDPNAPLTRAFYYGVWLVAVFGGGFFVHSLVSVVLFLALPMAVARRVSPAFRGWTERDRWIALGQLFAAVAFHVAIGACLGARGWRLIGLYPLLVFAWIYSVLIYVYHYRTSYGRPPNHNVRSLRAPRVFSWWLLNFNEHATHHLRPSVPWFDLPRCRAQLPAKPRGEDDRVETLGQAIRYLLRGPVLVRRTP